jgi:hypothetical protein
VLPLLISGCDDRSLHQRVEEIRQFSSRQDRAFTAEALGHIQRNYWTLRNRAWLGKLEGGGIVELDSPHVAAAPLPSRAFYSGWHLQLTVSSQDWRSYPAAPHEEAFEVTYAITRHSATRWDIRVTSGPVTSPLHREDAPRLQAGN